MTRFSSRYFLTAAGIAATAPLLKGCLGNPPDRDRAKTGGKEYRRLAGEIDELPPPSN
jgi:hypothetical protein